MRRRLPLDGTCVEGWAQNTEGEERKEDDNKKIHHEPESEASGDKPVAHAAFPQVRKTW
jgi:hypothetical protein